MNGVSELILILVLSKEGNTEEERVVVRFLLFYPSIYLILIQIKVRDEHRVEYGTEIN